MNPTNDELYALIKDCWMLAGEVNARLLEADHDPTFTEADALEVLYAISWLADSL